MTTPRRSTGVCGDRIGGTPGLTESKSHRWQLAVHGREWVKHCLEVVGTPIGNHVYKNRAAVRWLKQLGLQNRQSPTALGAPFCRFWRVSDGYIDPISLGVSPLAWPELHQSAMRITPGNRISIGSLSGRDQRFNNWQASFNAKPKTSTASTPTGPNSQQTRARFTASW